MSDGPSGEASKRLHAAMNASTASNHSNEANREAGRQLEPTWKEQGRGQDRYFLLKADEPAGTAWRALRHAAILGLLMFASIWGLLAREGLIALNTYSGMSVEPTIWAQAVGCLVMGWAVGNKEALETWYPPAYIAIGTGFCGSLTTFSSWILHVFQAYGNQRHYDRHGLHNVMDALTQTAVTVGMSLAALYAGQALSGVLSIRPLLHHLERHSTHKKALREARRSRTAYESNNTKAELLDVNTHVPYTRIPDLIGLLTGVLFWAAAATLCGTYAPFRNVTYAMVLSPPGAILRWYLSPLNSHSRSKHFPYWPLGTLAANIIATAVLCAVFVGQHAGRTSGVLGGGASTRDGCYALYGVQEGFCGCLSTISTFAVELNNIKPRRRAAGYAVGSYVLGIVLCVLIIGTPWWSIGMDGSCVGITL